MNGILCATLLCAVGQIPTDLRDRERHPLAPSLPRLTKAEEQKIDAIIERMIQADTGKLQGAAAKSALEDFNRLGPEASFNLIDGLNRTANMESSCPAVIIAKRLAGILLSTEDIALLTFAKENIGAGVTAKRHLNVLSDLQFKIQLRKGALQRRALAAGDKGLPKPLSSMSLAELEKAIGKERGPHLKAMLSETEKRQGTRAVDVLLLGIASSDQEIAKLSQGLLAKNLQHQKDDDLKALLKHDRSVVRIAAAQAVGARKLHFGAELIALLQDGDADVRQAGRRSLVQISGGVDHGPEPDASFGERETAIARWREWWSKVSDASKKR